MPSSAKDGGKNNGQCVGNSTVDGLLTLKDLGVDLVAVCVLGLRQICQHNLKHNRRAHYANIMG